MTRHFDAFRRRMIVDQMRGRFDMLIIQYNAREGYKISYCIGYLKIVLHLEMPTIFLILRRLNEEEKRTPT